MIEKKGIYSLLIILLCALFIGLTGCQQPPAEEDEEWLNDNANLQDLRISSGKLSPTFSAGIQAYTCLINSITTNVVITAVPEYDGAKIKINSENTLSKTLPILSGINSVTVEVTAKNGDTKTYTILISSDETLVESNIAVTYVDTIPDKGTFDFGKCDTYTDNKIDMWIENNGLAPLELTGNPPVAITGSYVFSVTSQPAVTVIESGERVRFTLNYSSGSMGSEEEAIVSIKSNDDKLPTYSFTITGSATSPYEQEINVVYGSKIIPNSGIIDLGTIPLNSTSTFDLTIQNLGSQDLIINDAVLSSAAQYSFTYNLYDYYISGNYYETVTLSIYPNEYGEYTDTVTIRNNDADEGSYSFVIKAICATSDTVPNVIYDGNMVNSYDVVNLGDLSLTENHMVELTVKNMSSSVMSLSGNPKIEITDYSNQFNVELEPASPLSPGEKSNFKIGITPKWSGNYSASISIEYNDIETFTFTFSARFVTPDINIRVDTTNIAVDATYDITSFVSLSGLNDIVFTLENLGTSDLHLNDSENLRVTISGDPSYSIVTMPNSPLKPGQDTQFIVRFDNVYYNQSATVTIVSDDYNESIYTFHLDYVY